MVACLVSRPSMAAGGTGMAAGSMFTTSLSFDMIASLQSWDKLKDTPTFSHLSADPVFTAGIARINENARASKLCNFYSVFNGDLDSADKCVEFFSHISDNAEITARSSQAWINNIIGLQDELSYCLSAVKDAGYPDYWNDSVRPVLERHIASYPVSAYVLTSIHDALTEFSGPEPLSDKHSNIYVLDIDNAFNLSDESFCCTPVLLDPELEKQFRLDFLKVYTHENLHRLSLSDGLIERLDALKADEFYRENELVARRHNEGGNEALVVAAEVFISHRIGRRDAQSVYDEFREYVDGSLVLAPIIYLHLVEKKPDESLDSFVSRLFDDGVIKAGHVKSSYDNAMRLLTT